MTNFLLAGPLHLSANGYQQCSENGQKGIPDIVKTAVNLDLKEIGEKSLPEGINRGKIDSVSGPCVLQIQKIRNVAAPKQDEESRVAPHLLKVTLTDGQSNCNGLILDNIDKLSLNTPPGTKLKLIGLVPVQHGFLLLNSLCAKILGGVVEKMVQTWELKKSLASVAKNARTNLQSDGGGPPPFIPFGQRDRSQPTLTKKDNFRSLDVNKDVTKKEGNDEFAAQRQATIAEAQLAKVDGKSKTFGGGFLKKPNDRDVARIVEMGFTAEQAANSLRQTSDVQEAIDSLISSSSSATFSSNNRNSKSTALGGAGGVRVAAKPDKPRKGRRGRGGPDEEDGDDFGAPQSRPSGPATLFDFLETKITPVPKDESKNSSEPQQHHQRQYSSQGSNNNTASSSGGGGGGGFQSDYRRTQNLPPRLQNKQRAENQSRNSSRQPYDSYNKGGRSYDRSSQGSDRYNKTRSNRDDYHQHGYNDRYGNNGDYYDRYNNGGSDHYYYTNSASEYGGKSSHYRPQSTSKSKTTESDRGGASSRSYGDRSDSRSSSTNSNRYDTSSNGGSNGARSRSGAPHYNNNGADGYNNKENSYVVATSYGGGQSYYESALHQNAAVQSQHYYEYQQQGLAPAAQLHAANQQAYTIYHQQHNPKPSDYHQQHQHQQSNSYYDGSNSVGTNGHGDDHYVQQQYDHKHHTQQYSNQPDGDHSNSEVYVNYEDGQQRPPRKWKMGDYCLARYWEDGNMYRANVIDIHENSKTCIVSFTDYGNTEEVSLSDIKTVSKQAWTDSGVQTTILPPPPFQQILTIPPPPPNFSIPPPFTPMPTQGYAMEFRRGGQGPMYSNGRDRKARPTQSLYQPPASRN
ncbi:uncharacterized protein LOC141905443 isoform X2 [Tubulanus polymorphus]|uniref:uncharacterized protein LOC141905443 isoform X2 n=1 Tax=Tubulanus polymorphus TaxID=672921 RepID=UPI003DA24841